MVRLSISSLTIKLILALALVRLALPLEFYEAKGIYSYKIYPGLQDLVRKRLEFLDISIWNVLMTIWVFVFIFLVIRDFVRLFKYRAYLKTLINLTRDEDLIVFSKLLEDLGIRAKVSLVRAKEVQSPFMDGFIGGKIYLPDREYSRQDLRYILGHELTHLKFKDNLKRTLLVILDKFFWWNPPIKNLLEDMDQVMEISCDKKLVNILGDAGNLYGPYFKRV